MLAFHARVASHPAGGIRAAGGSVAAAVCLSYGGYGWAAFFLVLAVLNLAGGYWYLTIARSARASGAPR